MGGITVITLYVSVWVCVSTRLYYGTILSNVDELLQNLKSGTYVKVAETWNPLNTYLNA